MLTIADLLDRARKDLQDGTPPEKIADRMLNEAKSPLDCWRYLVAYLTAAKEPTDAW
ncbi:MAG: hypothetical protein KatS3mg082_1433 [Nitrospiraceae bacterium]|nr:MAG: hypothetical protein KatS3mg082_1433 [Nitrospiraceae bacterium]